MKTSEDGRAELVAALAGKGAHVDFEGTVRNFPPNLRGIRPEKAPHTAWQLLEHIRIAQADILDFAKVRLAKFKMPRTVVFTELPKTSTGKIQKFKLREIAKGV